METTGFFGIPIMKHPNAKCAKAVASGASNYVIKIEDSDKQDYLEYLRLLEAYGFTKHSDNGDGLDSAVFTASYIKEETVVTVSYLARKRQTVISFMQYIPMSKRLIYHESYTDDGKLDAKTKLYMMELWGGGSSFVFQLKNGHFVISDGGTWNETPYLLDFLESLVPEGKKPIIEAWIITHGHGDHYGVLVGFMDHRDWMDRVYVEGLYYSEPSEKVADACNSEIPDSRIRWVANRLKAKNGENCKLYRPQIGQRYYFCDITMDILFTQELVPYEDFQGDINNASTVCMFTVDGQKLLFSGDIHEEGFLDMMEIYSQDYFNLDIFTLNHHGFNTCNAFTDYASIGTLLVTKESFLTPNRTRREMRHLYESVKESFHWGDGTKVMTFPYEIGAAETLPHIEWIYHKGEERIKPARVQYTVPGRRFRGFIFEADDVLFVDDKLQDGTKELLKYLKGNPVYTSVYSARTTAELTRLLETVGIAEYFDAILGCDILDENNRYQDALVQSEKIFGLEHIHNILVVCHDMKTVEAAIMEGFRTLAVNKDADEELKFKASRGSIDCIGDMFAFLEREQILFENLKSYLRQR